MMRRIGEIEHVELGDASPPNLNACREYHLEPIFSHRGQRKTARIVFIIDSAKGHAILARLNMVLEVL